MEEKGRQNADKLKLNQISRHRWQTTPKKRGLVGSQ
jgi:hypothetical protein